MLRRRKRGESRSKQLVVDVYANPTLDVTPYGRQPGGPGLYVARMLRALGVESIVRVIGCMPAEGDVQAVYSGLAATIPTALGLTVFEIQEGPRGRMLRASTSCPMPSIIDSYSATVAIAAPVYWELSSHVLARLPSAYEWVVIDVQGFTRLGAEVENTSKLLPHILGFHRPPNTIVKASIEDLGYSVDMLVEGRVDILTLGDRGVVARESRDSYLVVLEPVAKGRTAIGAGDMFNAALSAFLSHGLPLAESIVAAHYAVYCIVDGRTCSFNEIVQKVRDNGLEVRARRVSLAEVLELVY